MLLLKKKRLMVKIHDPQDIPEGQGMTGDQLLDDEFGLGQLLQKKDRF